MQIKPSFGEKKQHIEYILRPSSYAIIFNENTTKIAVIQKGIRYFLPGGGIENGETKESCLHRELLEELGWAIEVQQYVGNAERYFYAEKEGVYYLNDGYFYICNKTQEKHTPQEDDYILHWVSSSEAQQLLVHDHQQWAVRQAILLCKQK
ncbi:8-oxo-dGTP diphosphatase [Bacillus sp. 491mf]|uniref:NUDIX hydrolase n=1 Tax=Bacillus TaxID=1386 RepID=UPI0008F0E7DF|nr:NUDIX hydrolase [Bacillus sp. 491mf]SFC78527.1 8-oxo-dGTP diphosphatase [Bacillus sp. 491mf]